MENKKQLVEKKGNVSTTSTGLEVRSLPDKDKATLALVLGQLFDAQKLYGKEPGQLRNAVELFSWVLADYPIERIVWGVGQYLKTRNDIPAPSDIVKIIDPEPPKKEWDKSFYIRLQQIFRDQGPYGLNKEEFEYIRGYEENVLRTHRKMGAQND